MKTLMIITAVTLMSVLMLGACGSGETKESETKESEIKEGETVQAPAAKVEVAGANKMAFDAPPKVGDKAKCPVMGGEFAVTDKSDRSEYKGKHYVFCCGGCKPQFDANPEKFLKN